MKVVSPSQMAFIEHHACLEEFSETDFMKEAGRGIAFIVHQYAEKFDKEKNVILLCGKGNNAGDAYVAGIHLMQLGYEVTAFQLISLSECSFLCRQNHASFVHAGGLWEEIENVEEMAFPLDGIIVDGIFGTGFKGSIEEPLTSIIHMTNQSQLPIISIDIPSGLDGETGEIKGEAIYASETAFLGLPKTGFFLKEGWNQVGKLRYVDFGLPEEYVDLVDVGLTMITPELMRGFKPEIKRNRHKYEAGFVVALAGSPGMAGAAILSSWSALVGGAGIVKLFHPEGMQGELTTSPYEIIKVPYTTHHTQLLEKALEKASSVLIGPGLGTHPESLSILEKVLPTLTKPCVIDADALTLLSEHAITLPKEVIFTPHLGEMACLLGLKEAPVVTREFLHACQEYVNEKDITLVLKGGVTFIFHPRAEIQINPYGDPGMATAGSGDVLTGLIAALLAQGLTTHQAASLGVFLHAIAGEYAAQAMTSYCMVASDIVDYFPDAFRF